MVKIKPLLPSLKARKRYILYEIISNKRIRSIDFIKKEMRNFIGDLGLAKAGLRFVKTKENKGIIQVNHTSLDDVRAGLALIYDKNVSVRTLKVSGLIDKVKAFL